jgi:WD40 repeat protein
VRGVRHSFYVLKCAQWIIPKVNSVRDQTASLLRDALLTARTYAFALRTHAVHAYHSAFITMPECTLLDSLTHSLVPDTLPRLVSPRESQWVPGPWILEGHDASVCAVAVSPDGLRIVSGSWDDTVRVWDANTGESLVKLTAHRKRVTAVAFSPDGNRFVSGSQDSTIRIWSTVTFEELAELTGHSDAAPVICVDFIQTTEGERIVAASQGYFEVLAWDAVTFNQLDLELDTDYLAAQELRCWMAVLSSTGKLLAATFDDFSLRVWETVSLCQVARLRVDGEVNLAFARDGSRLITGSRDGSFTTWNTTTFEQLFTFQARQTPVTLLPDGQLYVHGCSSAPWPWDPLTFGLAVEKLGNEGRTGGRVDCAAITPNGQHVVSGSLDDTLRIWDVTAFEKAFSGLHEGQEDTILDLSISPDGSRIVSCTKDGTVKLWDGYDAKELTNVDERDAEHVFSYVAFSADGASIALSSKRAVQVWDASTLRKRADLDGRGGEISFFPDGQRIMILHDNTCVVWTWQTGARAEREESASAVSGAVSPDGMQIALGLIDDTVRVWDADTLKEIAKLKGHTYMVWSVAFSPDGDCIASGGFDPDCSVRIWSARTFQPLATLDGTGRTVSHVMFSPDGRIVACRDEWRRARAWISCNAERSM